MSWSISLKAHEAGVLVGMRLDHIKIGMKKILPNMATSDIRRTKTFTRNMRLPIASYGPMGMMRIDTQSPLITVVEFCVESNCWFVEYNVGQRTSSPTI